MKAGQQQSLFVDQLFEPSLEGFRGTLTIHADQPIAPLSLRESRNGFGEPLYTTLPVVELGGSSADGQAVFPHLAAGGGYTTQLILINPVGDSLSGQVRLVGSDGRPLAARGRSAVL